MTPFQGVNRVSSPFGPRTSPLTGMAETHRGQDITAPDGDWRVRECTGGMVLRVSSDRWRGLYVDVQTAPNVFERYQHMQRIDVQAGQKVPQGTVLGLAGATGQVTGRHLHFGVYQGGAAEACAVNPQAWSGVPNRAGAHPGNSSLDGAPHGPGSTAPGLARYSGIVASPGDAAALEALLNQLRIPFTKEAV